MRKQQFSDSTLSQHICLLSLPFLLVLVLVPTNLSHLSLPLHPLKICIMQFVLHTVVGSCLHGPREEWFFIAPVLISGKRQDNICG